MVSIDDIRWIGRVIASKGTGASGGGRTMDLPRAEVRDSAEFKEDMGEALKRFTTSSPDYADTDLIDVLRRRDYARLDELGHTYLDYTGGSLYAESQVQEHLDLLLHSVFGNPHSSNPTSSAATHLAERAREDTLRFFHADPREYAVIFTQNASGALKIVAESYPFGPGSRLLLTADNHNSVNGLREFAAAKGASVRYIPLAADMRLDGESLASELAAGAGSAPSLLAYPAQSNFSGVQHDLGWIAKAQEKGFDVLIDAAAFAPTNELRLDMVHPDFIDISFYKMFGYPTGVGCLLARYDALKKLVRPWYAGGTVAFASVSAFSGRGTAHRLFDAPFAFEDGTIDYLALPAVSIGLRHLGGVGVKTVHKRVMLLTGWLVQALTDLRHQNGGPVCEIYGPNNLEARGATLLLNVRDPEGRLVDYGAVQRAADAQNISVRSGCHCNPGAREAALHMDPLLLKESFTHRAQSSEEFLESVHDRLDGGVRVSLGIVSNFADVYRFVDFVRGFSM
jgi:selenocysteine lyase/cysteine desulfurase